MIGIDLQRMRQLNKIIKNNIKIIIKTILIPLIDPHNLKNLSREIIIIKEIKIMKI